MSIHIGAEKGQIAPTILLPGDPLRARFFAEHFLSDVVCFNEVRGMLGFTGRHGNKRVSVMGTGMGMPTLSIYVNELVREYDVTTLMRVGTCGALQPELEIGDLILPMTSSTNSQVNRHRFGGLDYAPAADFELLLGAYEAAREREATVHVGGIYSSDTFYDDDPEWWKKWAAYGTLACEMETTALYTLAAKHGARALSILTVSDSLVTRKEASAEVRERGFPLMAEIALSIIP
ncbi:MAG: purine-nucleoside phosphorylase [bacterium]|nr:purine-nucleoside phosphorylase [bacterium]